MASLTWGIIFLFLVLELIVTIILVLPVPRKLRNRLARAIFQFHLGDKLSKPVLYIGIALSLALLESYMVHRRIVNRIQEEHGADLAHGAGAHHLHQHEALYHPQDKQRKYMAERNMYLAGFSLTLLFVIGRITKLMQESVELEEETERVRKFVEQSKQADEKFAVMDKKKD